MRLIDADALRKRMRELWSGDPDQKWQLLYAAEPVVANAPTVCFGCVYAEQVDASVESSTQWPEDVREYENGKALERSDYDLVELADAAIAALKAEVGRLQWMLDALAVIASAREGAAKERYMAELAARYEKEHGDD